MNKFFFLCLIMASTFILSCENRNLNPGPEVEAPLVALNYDQDNRDAPAFDGSTYEGAVLFPEDVISAFEGDDLVSIQYFIQDKPESLNLRIYRNSDSGSPEELIYSAALTSSTTANAWNEHQLTSPIRIGREDLWIAIEFFHLERLQVLGCDLGPAEENGDWILIDGEWRVLSQIAPDTDINWNIRAVINPQ